MVRDSALEWYLYADMPYAQSFPGEYRARLEAVRARVDLVELQPLIPETDIKREAVYAYATQVEPVRAGLHAFDQSLTDPELYWLVRTKAHS